MTTPTQPQVWLVPDLATLTVNILQGLVVSHLSPRQGEQDPRGGDSRQK
jgi:hypothetical protein